MDTNWKAEIVGEGLQHLEIELQPGASVQADAGSMIYCDAGIPIQASSSGGLMGGLKRALGGGATFFLQSLTNTSSKSRRVALASSHVGRIVAINLNELNGEIILNGNSFLAGVGNFEFGLYRVKGLKGLLASPGGPVMQRITGSGCIWIQATGNLIERTLQAGESIVINAGSLLGFTSAMEYEVTYQGMGSFIVNQKVFLGTISGPGPIWLQSTSPDKIAAAIKPFLHEEAGRSGIFSSTNP
jgi:uncharacterized protein (TIGR00266 family)